MKSKRVLVIAPRVPEYDRESGSRRVFHFIEFLLADGWAVTLLAENATDGDRYLRALRQRGVMCYAGAETLFAGDDYLPDPRSLIAGGSFDLAILVFWNIAERYMPLIRTLSPATRIVVDSVDLHFVRNARRILYAEPVAGQSPKLDTDYAHELMREINVYAGADASLTVSRKEAALLADFGLDATAVYNVPDGEDLERSTRPFDTRRGMLFIGNFRHLPNVEAVTYLLGDIVPRVDPLLLAQHPLSIVGNGAERIEDLFPRHASVHIVGWVPSVEPYFRQARITLVPLLHGAGTKRKLLQALMLGTPSVSTTIGIEGLDLHDGQEVLLADDPAHFARAVERLLEEADLWQRLALQGHVWVARTHSMEIVRNRFLSVIETIVAKPPLATPPRGVPGNLGLRTSGR